MVEFGGSCRSRLAGLFVLAISLCAFGALIMGPMASADESTPTGEPGAVMSPLDSCTTGVLCVWPEEGFNGFEGNEPCGSPGNEGSLFVEFFSAKNHCGESERLGFQVEGGVNYKACLNGGEERGNIGRFDYRQVIAGSC
jgi:hypothetical protein